jgi:hypothetical protein
VDELRLSDPVARRLGRFFADLMVTLAEDGVGGAESAEAIGTLWQTQTPTNRVGPAGFELDAETLVHGIGAVAIALADELVAVRRAAGAPDLTATDVWQEVARALDQGRLDDVGADEVIDLP